MSEATGPGPPAPPSEPFRGIEPFRYVDRRIFFVRSQETESLMRRVTLYRGVLLYGESGTGKSSLINAGLIPAALAGGFTPERLRVRPQAGEEIVVERVLAEEGEPPSYLPSNFVGGAEGAPEVVLSLGAFTGSLKNLPEGARPLLIFDQFEEFITLFEEAPAGMAAEQASARQRELLDAIVELLQNQALPVKILLVFREDYLAKLDKLFDRCPNLPDQYLRLRLPDVAALPRIIRGPFDTFPGHFVPELPKELAHDLAAIFKAREHSGHVNLSEVQIACLKLWQSGDPVRFFWQKGMEGLLVEHLSDTLDKLDESLRQPAAALLTHLVTPMGTRNVVSEGDLKSMVQREEGYGESVLGEALKALRDNTGLVRRELRHKTYYYELVSEFLIPKIRQEREERANRLKREESRRVALFAVGAALVFAAFAIVCLFLYGQAVDAARKEEHVVRLTAENRRAEVEVALLRSQLKEPVRSSLWLACAHNYDCDKVLPLLKSAGFLNTMISRELVADEDAAAPLNVISYDPENVRNEELRKAALALMHAGYVVKRIMADHSLRPDGGPTSPSIVVRGKASAERCSPLRLEDILQQDSSTLALNEAVRSMWEKCIAPLASPK